MNYVFLMAEFWQFDYGYKIKVLNGKNKNKEGWVVYGSPKGNICINTNEIPEDMSYSIREFPKNIEILSIANPYKIKDLFENDLSIFDFAKLEIIKQNPKKALTYRKYLKKEQIQTARRNLVSEISK